MADSRPLHEQGDGEAVYQPFDSEYEATRPARVRLRVAGTEEDVWSERKERTQIEKHVALGSTWLSIDFADGRIVESALVVPWTFD
jgi:hypothetical protein